MDILTTPRLLLRWFHPDDTDFLLGLLNEPSWIAGIRDAGVRNREGALAHMQTKLIAPYARDGHGFWLVQRREDGERLGLCGVFQREGLPLPDLGYGFAARHHGQGYAREAATACRDYAAQVLGLKTVLAITSPSNAASESLLKDLGFQDRGLQAGTETPTRQWQWQPPGTAASSDAADLDALMARMLACFDNRGGRIPTVAALPAYFTADARITPPGQAELDVAGFWQPRAQWLFEGRLRDFHEWELSHQTVIDGNTAERSSVYAKAGWMDGQPVKAQGRKWTSFQRDGQDRWRITRLVWRDEDGS